MQAVHKAEVARQAVDEKCCVTLEICKSKYACNIIKLRKFLCLISVEISEKFTCKRGVIDLSHPCY